MLGNFIRGGQLFLHNIVMLKQVAAKSIATSFTIAVILTTYISYPNVKGLDLKAGVTYLKAKVVYAISESIGSSDKNDSGNRRGKKEPTIDVRNDRGFYRQNVSVNSVLHNKSFASAYQKINLFLQKALLTLGAITLSLASIVFVIWSKFGKSAKATKTIDGNSVLTAKEVAKYLKKHKINSHIMIDDMPLIKDKETAHILAVGMTGSGKTNLLNKILPQVRQMNQPAIVLDQTGEMIARYYDPARGDIIFNPLDARSKCWDFWTDCTSPTNAIGVNDRLEKFANVLFGAKQSARTGDVFWDESIKTIFCACVEHLIHGKKKSIEQLCYMLNSMPIDHLRTLLKDTDAACLFDGRINNIQQSLRAILKTSSKPLKYIVALDDASEENRFSMLEFFRKIAASQDTVLSASSASSTPFGGWLFLSAPPHQREILMPLISSMVELASSFLVEMGENDKRRVWFIADELASLGNVPSMHTLMTESRKYGGCILAAIQSYHQLLENYGKNNGSMIFGQFGTKFLFRCNEPILTKTMSDMFGTVKYTQQQKNTSYGAHEYRDGISYSEQERTQPLVAANKFMELNDLECFVALPDPKIRVAQLQLSFAKVAIINQGFVPLATPLDQENDEMDHENDTIEETSSVLEIQPQKQIMDEDDATAEENNAMIDKTFEKDISDDIELRYGR